MKERRARVAPLDKAELCALLLAVLAQLEGKRRSELHPRTLAALARARTEVERALGRVTEGRGRDGRRIR